MAGWNGKGFRRVAWRLYWTALAVITLLALSVVVPFAHRVGEAARFVADGGYIADFRGR